MIKNIALLHPLYFVCIFLCWLFFQIPDESIQLKENNASFLASLAYYVIQLSWMIATSKYISLQFEKTGTLKVMIIFFYLLLVAIFVVVIDQTIFNFKVQSYFPEYYNNILGVCVLLGYFCFLFIMWNTSKYLNLAGGQERPSFIITVGIFVLLFCLPISIFFLHRKIRRFNDETNRPKLI